MVRAFISYATPDASAAEALSAHLEKSGLATWIAPRDVPTGVSHFDVIPQALAQCGAVVLVLSEATNSAAYVSREIDTAIAQKKRIIPVRLEDVMPSAGLMYLIGANQWIDAFREPTDVWRDYVSRLVAESETVVEPTGFKRRRNIVVSPVMLLLAAVVLLATAFAALLTTASAALESRCSLTSPIDCLYDPEFLASLFLILTGLCILLPRMLRSRRRYVVLEARDAMALGGVALMALLAIFFRDWLVGLLVVLYLAIYPFVRHWLDGTRAVISVLLLVALGGGVSYGEGMVYRSLMRGAGNTLFLFKYDRLSDQLPDVTNWRIYRDFDQALADIGNAITVDPGKLPTQDDFLRIYRSVDLDRDLTPLFRRSVLRLTPFNLILVVDAINASPCGTSFVDLYVSTFDFKLGSPPRWADGSAVPRAGWQDFRIDPELRTEGGTQVLANPGRTEALFAAYFIGWLAGQTDLGINDNPALYQAERKALDELHFQFSDRTCANREPNDKFEFLCHVDTQDPTALRQALQDAYLKLRPEIEPAACAPELDAARQLANQRTIQIGR